MNKDDAKLLEQMNEQYRKLCEEQREGLRQNYLQFLSHKQKNYIPDAIKFAKKDPDPDPNSPTLN